MIAMTLLFFAALGFSGAGVAYAVGRAHEVAEAESDFGMRALSVLLFGFGAVCTYVAAGLSGVLAYGGTLSWFSYVLSAHRLGVFEVNAVAGAGAGAGRVAGSEAGRASWE